MKDVIDAYLQRAEDEYERKKQYPREDHWREARSKLTGEEHYRMLDHPPPAPTHSYHNWTDSDECETVIEGGISKSQEIDEVIRSLESDSQAPQRHQNPYCPSEMPKSTSTNPTAYSVSHLENPSVGQRRLPHPNTYSILSPYSSTQRIDETPEARNSVEADEVQTSTGYPGSSSRPLADGSHFQSRKDRLVDALKRLPKSDEQHAQHGNPANAQGVDKLVRDKQRHRGWQ